MKQHQLLSTRILVTLAITLSQVTSSSASSYLAPPMGIKTTLPNHQQVIDNVDEISNAILRINNIIKRNKFSSALANSLAQKIASMKLIKGKTFLVVGPGNMDYFPMLLSELGLKVTMIDTEPNVVDSLLDYQKNHGWYRNIDIHGSYSTLEGRIFDYISIFSVMHTLLDETFDSHWDYLKKQRGPNIFFERLKYARNKVHAFLKPILDLINMENGVLFITHDWGATDDIITTRLSGFLYEYLNPLNVNISELPDVNVNFTMSDGSIGDERKGNAFQIQAESSEQQERAIQSSK